MRLAGFGPCMPRLSREARWIVSQPNPTDAWLYRCHARLQNRDAVVCITGPEGHTKSTCAEHIANIVDSDFTRENIVYNARDYLERIVNAPKRSAIIPDEGVEIFHNRNSARKESKLVNEVLMECRIFHHIHLPCFPRFMSTDLYMRTFRIWSWVRCLRPGVAEVRVRNWNIPVGETEEDAKEAYPVVCGLLYPPIDEDEWAEREKEKEDYVAAKVQDFLEDE